VIIAEGGLNLTWLNQADLQQLRDLYRCTYASEKWTVNDFNRFQHKEGRTNVLKVLKDEDGVVYASLMYTLEPDVCRIRRVAVWPDYRRRGLARFMVNSLCGPYSPIRRKKFVTRVLETNTTAQMFLSQGMGFVFDAKKQREKNDTGLEYYEFGFDRA
jgi:predicted GNAT family acetyltransferase